MPREIQIFSLIIAVFTILLWPNPAEAQEPDTVIVMLSTEAPPFDEVLEGFRDHLREKNPEVRIRILEEGQTLEEIGGTDLILALGSEALVHARAQNSAIPIVAGMIMKKEDIVNFPQTTGIFLEYPAKIQLRWMRRIFPDARRIGVVYSSKENLDFIENSKRILDQLGFQLLPQEVSGPRELPAALKSLANTADLLWGVNDQIVLTPQTARPILLFSFRNRIPFIGLSHAWTRAGAFYSLDRDYHDLGRQCGELAARILQGEQAGKIPPAAPRKVTYSLNLKTAQRMKLEISPSVLQGAEQVY